MHDLWNCWKNVSTPPSLPPCQHISNVLFRIALLCWKFCSSCIYSCTHNSTCINNTCVADPKKGTVDSSCSSDDDCVSFLFPQCSILLVFLFDGCLVRTCVMYQQQMQSWLHVWYLSNSSLLHLYRPLTWFPAPELHAKSTVSVLIRTLKGFILHLARMEGMLKHFLSLCLGKEFLSILYSLLFYLFIFTPNFF